MDVGHARCHEEVEQIVCAGLTERQVVACDEELRVAVGLVDLGIRELRRIDGSNDMVFTVLELLSQGFERWGKLTLVLAQLERDGSLPTARALKSRYAHNVDKIIGAVADEARRPRYLESKGWAREDVAYLREDPHWRRLLGILSKFAVAGGAGRYANLSALTSDAAQPVSTESSAMDDWSALEFDLLRSQPGGIDLLTSERSHLVWSMQRDQLTAVVQRAARAMARLYCIELLGRDGQRLWSHVSRFAQLRDSQLATPPQCDAT